ncbi:MAG: OmpP1/FadL family transporter [Alphaproteobacteria bacterium]|nr:OmpP1/FadL family transporter [Alphaproteobacteria bacterium]
MQRKWIRISGRIAAVAAILIGAQAAQAGGYQLNDYSATGLGRSFAGAGVVGDDYSAIAFNPAGMSLAKRSGFQAGVTPVNLRSRVADLSSARTGELSVTVPVPHAFAQYKVNDKVDVGLGVYAPYGLATRYKSNWIGRDAAILSKLDIIDIAPAVSYRITDRWSVGASVIARYIYGHMTNEIKPETGSIPGSKSDFELDGWTIAGSLGVLYQPTDDTRVGFSWRSGSKQQVKGDHKMEGLPGLYAAYNGTYTGRSSPDLPQTFTLAGYQKIQKFGLSGTLRWTGWSESFPRFVMESENPMFAGKNGVAKSSVYNWRNTWTIAAGLDYYHTDSWTFRAGTAWDQSPAKRDAERTLRIPDTDRFWLSAGFSYIRDSWQLDAGYAYMIGRTAVVREGGEAFKYTGMRGNLLGIQAQFKF